MKSTNLFALFAFGGCLFAGELADFYTKMYENRTSKHLAPKAELYLGLPTNVITQHGVTAISLSRTWCLGKCPVYSITLSNNGSCLYDGVVNVERLGKWSGQIPKYYFDHLAAFACEIGFESITVPDLGVFAMSDASESITTIVRSNKCTKLCNPEGRGPIRLWAFESLIDGALYHVKWDRLQADDENKIP